MADSERELLPETASREIAVDDELAMSPQKGGGPSWITPVALLLGLVLTVVLLRIGVYFFFLPIILPFGLGGGRWFRQFFPAPRRVLRLEDGLLVLAAKGARKTSTLDRLDVSRGAFVTARTASHEGTHVRVVSAEGILMVPVLANEHARKLQRELIALFEAANIPLLGSDA